MVGSLWATCVNPQVFSCHLFFKCLTNSVLVFLYIWSFKTSFYLILVKWDQCFYLSDFSSSNRVTFLRGPNSSSLGKACFIASPCFPLWYLLLCVSSLTPCLSLLNLLSGEVESGSEGWGWVLSGDDLWVGHWRMNRNLPSGERRFKVQCSEKVKGKGVEYIMMEVQGNSEGMLQNVRCPLILVLKDNLHGPHYVKKN